MLGNRWTASWALAVHRVSSTPSIPLSISLFPIFSALFHVLVLQVLSSPIAVWGNFYFVSMRVKHFDWSLTFTTYLCCACVVCECVLCVFICCPTVLLHFSVHTLQILFFLPFPFPLSFPFQLPLISFHFLLPHFILAAWQIATPHTSPRCLLISCAVSLTPAHCAS